LPGIAGIILTVGMAVDANVLIYERIKEEIKSENNKILAFDSDGELSVTQELGTFRGNWATSTAYVLRDIVVQNSASDSSTYKSVYICKTANTSTGSYLTQSDSSKWDKLVDLAAYDTLSELSDTTIGSLSSGHMLLYDGSDSWDNKAMSGDATISSTGALTIASGAVETGMIAADAITGAKIADDAINSEHYTDGSIDTAHIADDQVTQAKIAAGAVGSTELADDGVTLAKMAGLARGKIIYGDASGNPAALTIGTNGQALKSDGTDLVWGSAGGGATIVHTFTNSTNTSYAGTASSFGTVGVGDRDIYIKKIDANNEGVFTKVWKNGSAVEVQIA